MGFFRERESLVKERSNRSQICSEGEESDTSSQPHTKALLRTLTSRFKRTLQLALRVPNNSQDGRKKEAPPGGCQINDALQFALLA